MSEPIRQFMGAQISKTLAAIADECDNAKEAVLALNVDNLRDDELSNVFMILSGATLPSLAMTASGLQALVVASESNEE